MYIPSHIGILIVIQVLRLVFARIVLFIYESLLYSFLAAKVAALEDVSLAGC
jgi:hypothetical protein